MTRLDDEFKDGGASHAPPEDDSQQLGEVIPADGMIAETAAALNEAAGERVGLVQWSMDRFVAPQDIIDAAKLPEAEKVKLPNSRQRTSSASSTPQAAGVEARKAPPARSNARTTKEKAGRTRQQSEVASRAGRDRGKPAEKLSAAKDGAEDLGTKTTTGKTGTKS